MHHLIPAFLDVFLTAFFVLNFNSVLFHLFIISFIFSNTFHYLISEIISCLMNWLFNWILLHLTQILFQQFSLQLFFFLLNYLSLISNYSIFPPLKKYSFSNFLWKVILFLLKEENVFFSFIFPLLYKKKIFITDWENNHRIASLVHDIPLSFNVFC